MERYRLLRVEDAESGERQMNDLAEQGYRFVGMSTMGGVEAVFIVMEYDGRPRAGAVADEALQASIPSQGPTAERSWTGTTSSTSRV